MEGEKQQKQNQQEEFLINFSTLSEICLARLYNAPTSKPMSYYVYDECEYIALMTWYSFVSRMRR